MKTEPSTTAEPSPPAELAEPATPVDLLVVIVNYRSAGLTVDCLASLEDEVRRRPGTLVVVVENDSGPEQAEQIRRAIDRRGWGGWARLVEAARNGGFAAGNNVAIRPALAWYRPPAFFWLLNPDTVVRPGALDALRRCFDEHPEAGLAGSRLEFPDGTPQFSTFPFPSVLGEFEGGLRFAPVTRRLLHRSITQPIPNEPRRVDWVAGASLMIRREVFEAVGLLDERYFMYYEEVDFCRRAASAGWPCWYDPASRVVHLVGQSSDVTSAAGATRRRPAYWFEARKLYLRTHLGGVGAAAADLLHVAAFATYRARRLLQRKPDRDPRLMLWDLFRHSFLPVHR